MARILVATRDGLRSFDDGGVGRPVEHAGRAVGALAAERAERWAILEGNEVWRSSGAGWEQVGGLDGYRATCVAPTEAGLLVGSSEARLFRLAEAALRPVAGFDQAEGRSSWYTPWGGPPDTRSISEWEGDVYVNVHVGGILRSNDAGRTWSPTIEVDQDVHQVATAEGLVLAACAGGLAASTDHGATWTLRTEGLVARYSRAVAVCGDVVLVSSSNGPRGGRAAVYRGGLRGGPLERCRDGLPEWFVDNVDTSCLDSLPDGSLAAFGTADGALYASADAGATWWLVASGLPAVHHVLVLP